MSILYTARQIQAVCQPITGDRATGEVKLRSAVGADVEVRFGSVLFPIVSGQTRYDLPFKVVKNEATDNGHWIVSASGTSVNVMSNIGGARHNQPKGTRFVVDQPVRPDIVVNPLTETGTEGGTDPEGDLALYNFVTYESFGSKPNLEMFKASIGGRFPAAIIHWIESEPADGLTTSAVQRPTSYGRKAAQYQELFEILLIVNKSEAEVERRGQGMRLLDELSALLLERVSVDSEGMSSPGGINIKRRYRALGGEDGFYKTFQVYALQLTVQVTITQRDTRVYDELRRFKINAPREDSPAADLPVVVDNLVDNPQE